MKKSAFAILALALIASACAKNSETKKNVAGTCGMGQVLTYTTERGYVCKIQTNSATGMAYYPPAYQTGAYVESIFAPVASCADPAVTLQPGQQPDQELVQYNGNWYCAFLNTFHNSQNDSPQGAIPPIGQGSERCNANLNNGYGNTYPGQTQPPVGVPGAGAGVICLTGYYCHPTNGTSLNTGVPYTNGTGTLTGTCRRLY